MLVRKILVGASAIAMGVVPSLGTSVDAATGTGTLTLMSTSSAGVKADYGASGIPVISDDGSILVFESQNSTTLVPGLINRGQVYVKDVKTGLTSVASAAFDGTPGNGLSRVANVSGNGRYVVFVSDSTNLHSSVSVSGLNVYVKDLVTGTIEVANRDAGGVVIPGVSGYRPAVSNDGDVVAFATQGPLVAGHTERTCDDGEGGFYDCTPTEIYVKRMSSNDVTAVTLLGSTGSSIANTLPIDMTSDGSKLVITTFDQLVSHDQDAQSDAYVISLVDGVPTGAPTLVSTQWADGVADIGLDRADFAKISNDGTRIVYQGIDDQLGAYPTTQVFLKDLTSGTMQVLTAGANALSQNPSISPDGGVVTFSTNATNLHPGDGDSIADVLLRDLSTGSVTLISQTDAGTKGNKPTFVSQVSADGAAVFFMTTATNFDPNDNDVYSDVYKKTLFEPVADGNLSFQFQSEAGRSIETGSSDWSWARVSNESTGTVSGVTLRIELPAEVDLDGWDPEDACSVDAGTIVCPLGDIPPNGIRTVGIGFVARSDAPEGNYSVRWSVTTDSAPDPIVYFDDFAIAEGSPPPPPGPDVSVNQRVGQPGGMAVGVENYFELSLGVGGPEAAFDVAMFNRIPEEFEVVGVSDTSSCNVVGQLVTCTYSSLAPDETRSVEVRVIPLRVAGLVTNTVYVGSSSTLSTGEFWDIDELLVTISPSQADLGVSIADLSGMHTAGQRSQFRVSVNNDGPQLAHDVSFSIHFDDSLSLDIIGCDYFQYIGATIAYCEIDDLAADATVDFDVFATPSAPATAIELLATVSTQPPDGSIDENPDNNQTSLTFDVQNPQPDVVVTGSVVLEPSLALESGVVSLNCDGSSGGSGLNEDGSYTVSVSSSSATSCLLEIRLRQGSTSVVFRRNVAIVDGAGSADFQVPPLLTVNFLDPTGEPILAAGTINAFEDEVVMPDGGISYVFTSTEVIPTGPPLRIISLRDRQTFFNIEDYTATPSTGVRSTRSASTRSTSICPQASCPSPVRQMPTTTGSSMTSMSMAGPGHHPVRSAMTMSMEPSCRHRSAGRFSSPTNPIPMASGSRWMASPGPRRE